MLSGMLPVSSGAFLETACTNSPLKLESILILRSMLFFEKIVSIRRPLVLIGPFWSVNSSRSWCQCICCAGDAIVYGKSVSRDMQQIRKLGDSRCFSLLFLFVAVVVVVLLVAAVSAIVIIVFQG